MRTDFWVHAGKMALLFAWLVLAGALRAGEDEDMDDFLGGVYRGRGEYVKAGSTASGRDGTIVRSGSVYFTPRGQYQRVGSVYLTPDGDIVTRAGNSFVSRDDIRVKAGGTYNGRDGTTVTAGSAVFKPDWASRK